MTSTVLLVEPPADDRAMYAVFLRGHGLRTIELDDPDAALREAAQADVVVTGIRLRSASDGLALVRRLRGQERTRATPVIVLSACAFDTDRESAVAAGCDAFLTKPCSPDLLLAEVEKLILRARLDG